MTPQDIAGFIRRGGHAMSYARAGLTAATVRGHLASKGAAETVGGLGQSDCVIVVDAEALRAAGYGAAQHGDTVTAQGKTYWVRDAHPMIPPGHDAPGGFRLICRGEGVR